MRLRHYGLRLAVLRILHVAVCTGALSYHEEAMARHRAGAPNSELAILFRAHALLVVQDRGFDAWNNLGVALMHAATDSKASAEAERHALWSLAAFELARRLDTLQVMPVIDANVRMLCDGHPTAKKLVDANPRAYWRPSVLHAGTAAAEAAISVAQSGREDESLLYFWQGLLDGGDAEAPTWLNLAVSLNKARRFVTGDPARFAKVSALGLAAFEHARAIYDSDGTPIGADGLTAPIRDNAAVKRALQSELASSPRDRAADEAAATAMVTKLDWPMLRTTRFQAQPPQLAQPAQLSADDVDRRPLAALVIGLFSDAVMLGRVFGRRSPRLKREALILARAAIEAAGLHPAIDAAKRGSRGAALRALATSGAADVRLLDPMPLTLLGLLASAVADDVRNTPEAEYTVDGLRPLVAEAAAAFHLALALAPSDKGARVGLTELREMNATSGRMDVTSGQRVGRSGGEAGIAVDAASLPTVGTGVGVVDDKDWEEHVGGSPALRARLAHFLDAQRRAASWLAGEMSAEEPAPKILIGHVPNVGMGNQAIALISYLAHALLSGRALFFTAPDLQACPHRPPPPNTMPKTLSPAGAIPLFTVSCHLRCTLCARRADWQCSDVKREGENSNPSGSKAHLLFCHAFDLRHEQPTAPLWQLTRVLERARSPGRVSQSDTLMEPIKSTSHVVTSDEPYPPWSILGHETR